MQTVEGITAAIILLSVLALVIQATSVTPLTSSFTNQHVKIELQNMGQDVLTTLDETNSIPNDINSSSLLKESVLDWMKGYRYDWYAWNNTTYVSLTDPINNSQLNTPLGNSLSFLLTKYGIAYNVEVSYSDISGHIRNTKMIWNGDPSQNSVTVSRVVVLHDGDREVPIGDYDSNYILPDISPGTNLHNIAEIRLTLWVM
jgi:hypothetical protein